MCVFSRRNYISFENILLSVLSAQYPLKPPLNDSQCGQKEVDGVPLSLFRMVPLCVLLTKAAAWRPIQTWIWAVLGLCDVLANEHKFYQTSTKTDLNLRRGALCKLINMKKLLLPLCIFFSVLICWQLGIGLFSLAKWMRLSQLAAKSNFLKKSFLWHLLSLSKLFFA